MTGRLQELGSRAGDEPDVTKAILGASQRPRHWPGWVVPAAVGTVIIVALLAAGRLSPAFLLYGGVLAGCALMHVFGRHGGHGAHGGQADGGEFGGGPSSPLR